MVTDCVQVRLRSTPAYNAKITCQTYRSTVKKTQMDWKMEQRYSSSAQGKTGKLVGVNTDEKKNEKGTRMLVNVNAEELAKR